MVQTPARNVTMSAMPSPFMSATRTFSGTGENWKPRSGWPSWSKSMKSWPVDGRYTPKSSGSPARAVPAINAAARANTRKVLRELYVKEAAESLSGTSAGDDPVRKLVLIGRLASLCHQRGGFRVGLQSQRRGGKNSVGAG